MPRDEMDGPADTSMMGIVHSALRRDLERARIVLAAGDVPDARRRAMAEHLLWMMGFLHEHHESEDTGLYPMVRATDPNLAPLLDAMDGEHELIHPAMEAVEAAVRTWAMDPSAQQKVQAALSSLGAVLDRHLRHEETEMMPKVSAAITHREWHEWDQRDNVGTKKPRELAYVGHWLIDNTNAADRETVVHEVPAVPRFFLLHFMGGPYQKRRAAMWDSTPAAAVPSLSLAELDKGH